MSRSSDEKADTRADVIIVGGGIAGLTCAVGLRNSGLRVVVIERDERLGGRNALLVSVSAR